MFQHKGWSDALCVTAHHISTVCSSWSAFFSFSLTHKHDYSSCQQQSTLLIKIIFCDIKRFICELNIQKRQKFHHKDPIVSSVAFKKHSALLLSRQMSSLGLKKLKEEGMHGAFAPLISTAFDILSTWGKTNKGKDDNLLTGPVSCLDDAQFKWTGSLHITDVDGHCI